jgi:hypothetical protein
VRQRSGKEFAALDALAAMLPEPVCGYVFYRLQFRMRTFGRRNRIIGGDAHYVAHPCVVLRNRTPMIIDKRCKTAFVTSIEAFCKGYRLQ